MSVTRMQILLTEEQAARLRAMSRERRMSISALVREMVEQSLQEEQDRLLMQQEKALEKISAVHHALEEDGAKPMSGEEIVEMIREMREERTDEIARDVLRRN